MPEHRHLVFALVLDRIAAQGGFFGLWSAAHKAEIQLLKLAVLHLLIEDTQAFGVLGGDHNSAGVAVDAVDKRRREGFFGFGVIFALFI